MSLSEGLLSGSLREKLLSTKDGGPGADLVDR